MVIVAAPAPVGTRLYPSGQRGKQAGLDGAERGTPPERPVLRQTPAARRGAETRPNEHRVASHSPKCGKRPASQGSRMVPRGMPNIYKPDFEPGERPEGFVCAAPGLVMSWAAS